MPRVLLTGAPRIGDSGAPGGRRRVFLIGAPGVGKTTAALRAVDLLRAGGLEPVGFCTEEVRAGARRLGFDIVTLDGERTPLARRGHASRARVGAYDVFVENVDAAAEALLGRLPDLGADAVLVIDEIGSMELHSARFRGLVERAFAAPMRLLATVKKAGGPFAERVLSGHAGEVLEVTRANRDEVPGLVAARLR